MVYSGRLSFQRCAIANTTRASVKRRATAAGPQQVHKAQPVTSVEDLLLQCVGEEPRSRSGKFTTTVKMPIAWTDTAKALSCAPNTLKTVPALNTPSDKVIKIEGPAIPTPGFTVPMDEVTQCGVSAMGIAPSTQQEMDALFQRRSHPPRLVPDHTKYTVTVNMQVYYQQQCSEDTPECKSYVSTPTVVLMPMDSLHPLADSSTFAFQDNSTCCSDGLTSHSIDVHSDESDVRAGSEHDSELQAQAHEQAYEQDYEQDYEQASSHYRVQWNANMGLFNGPAQHSPMTASATSDPVPAVDDRVVQAACMMADLAEMSARLATQDATLDDGSDFSGPPSWSATTLLPATLESAGDAWSYDDLVCCLEQVALLSTELVSASLEEEGGSLLSSSVAAESRVLVVAGAC